MAGNATVAAPNSSATASELRKHAASRSDLSLVLAYVGPTVWMTLRAANRPAVLATASPVGNPSGNRVSRSRRHSARTSGPPRRVDGSVHATATEQSVVGRIDDCIHLLFSDVSLPEAKI